MAIRAALAGHSVSLMSGVERVAVAAVRTLVVLKKGVVVVVVVVGKEWESE